MKNIKLLLLTGLSLMALAACSSKPETVTPTPEAKPADTSAMETESVDEVGKMVTFNLTGENFKFIMDGTEAPDLRVKKGNRVRINFTSANGLHNWVVDDFGAATEQVQTGNSTFVEFTANETGTFEYYCSVGEHRANGMRGNLIIE